MIRSQTDSASKYSNDMIDFTVPFESRRRRTRSPQYIRFAWTRMTVLEQWSCTWYIPLEFTWDSTVPICNHMNDCSVQCAIGTKNFEVTVLSCTVGYCQLFNCTLMTPVTAQCTQLSLNCFIISQSVAHTWRWDLPCCQGDRVQISAAEISKCMQL